MAKQSWVEKTFLEGKGATDAHRKLDVFIGKWINVGEMLVNGKPVAKIATSDIYEWVPGGFFILHTAYGRIGDADVGGVELIGYDQKEKKYKTYFFDSQGNVSTHEFILEDNKYVGQGEGRRSTGVFKDNGKTFEVLHEIPENDKWVPSMEVVLRKVE